MFLKTTHLICNSSICCIASTNELINLRYFFKMFNLILLTKQLVFQVKKKKDSKKSEKFVLYLKRRVKKKKKNENKRIKSKKEKGGEERRRLKKKKFISFLSFFLI